MKSLVVKRAIVVHGHKTSVSLEDTFWRALKELATTGGTSLSDLVGSIAAGRVDGGNLSSAIRVHVIGYFRDKTAAPAGNGVASVQRTAALATPEQSPQSAHVRLR
jgi:predicted DNA-binding ribbon-helix-helix protein